MPLIVASRAVIGMDSRLVLESIKTRMRKQASELKRIRKVKFAKEAGFEYHNGTITGTWFYSKE